MKYIEHTNPVYQINPDLLAKMESAQDDLLERNFKSSGDIFEKALDDLKLDVTPPQSLYDKPIDWLVSLPFSDILGFSKDLLISAGLPAQSLAYHTANIAQQIQLTIAFSDPEAAVTAAEEKVESVVGGFPREARHIEVGRNPGDVLDPYILAATQYLLSGGSIEKAIEQTVGHKALMMIEGLMGHLHEDMLGLMRGNVRAPEPRGREQEILNYESNPFPGADLVQPPWSEDRPIRFHQIKSKTGSAKGGDGKRLGQQLQLLQERYGGGIYYHALIGNTLRGHRSMAGVKKAAPEVVVLVGQASFEELTGSSQGPELLLRVYQSAFQAAAEKTGYRIDLMAETIVLTFQERAEEQGEGFLESILSDVTNGDRSQQDSRFFAGGRRRRS
ncbi:hypothetical protein ACUY1T_02680 [Billgrantia sp. Q4P2]|uniref:hypothetical protein n=1 Tax=Billgrantia sp. Q4P2 TaxID=3463857 RepID=UPI0040576A9E